MRGFFVLVVGLLSIDLVGSTAVSAGTPGDLAEFIRSSYTKFEYRVPMRDGVRLHTAIYVPNDASSSRTYPFLMRRTPYGASPYGVDRYSDSFGLPAGFAHDGYIVVIQDVRGRFMSEGEFVNMRPHRDGKRSADDVDESSDTYDTVEWLLSHVKHHNGRVGILGNSYQGFYTSAGIIDTHPAIKAAMPSAPIADWFFDDMHHHGAFALNLSFNFFSVFGQVRDGLTTEWPKRFDHGTPDGYGFFLELGPLSKVESEYFRGDVPFWSQIVAHPNYDGFWQERSVVQDLRNVTCAVMTVGGLFDAEDLYGPFSTYGAIEELNEGITNTLVMGPWSHGAWLRGPGEALGDAEFGFATGQDFRDRVMYPFFENHLKGDGSFELPEAMVFETGANRWRSFDQWPPASTESHTLHAVTGGDLSWETPNEVVGTYDEFVSDPSKPVPYTSAITTGWRREYMTEDQRFAARRPDVLVYRSEQIAADVTVAGPIEVELWVSTTGTDADWVVKIIDEFPDRLPGYDADSDEADRGGTQRMVRSEIFRGRYRNSYENPEPFVPGQPTRVVVPLQAVLHTFKKGHRIMIQVQSSFFPFFDRNPQTYVENIFEAEEKDFVKATHRVYSSAEYPSVVRFSVLPSD